MNRHIMRNGQNKRMRGRNHHRKNQNPMSRVFESNGPDVKIRGNPAHIAEKYVQLARDAQASGDPISAENYYQHAEHYYRLIAAAQEQFRQNNPHFARPDSEVGTGARDDAFEEDEDGAGMGAGDETPFGTREPQPYLPRDAQPFSQNQQHNSPRPNQPAQPNGAEAPEVDRLPSFITGGAQPAQANHGPNGHDSQPDRFPLHRRRRRYRGPRQDFQGGQPAGGGSGNDGDDSSRGD
jgi:Domain of unknown function (DUF4167)